MFIKVVMEDDKCCLMDLFGWYLEYVVSQPTEPHIYSKRWALVTGSPVRLSGRKDHVMIFMTKNSH